MRITRVSAHTVVLPLSLPYTIAYETVTDVINHFLVIETDAGITGTGCAAPAPEVTGETADASLDALNRLPARLAGAAPEEAAKTVLPGLANTPSAMAALDLALAEISARTSTGPQAGVDPDEFIPVVTSITIGIMGVSETLERAKFLVGEGFLFLKIKGGHDVETDIERLTVLRSEFGPSLLLALDANQGYSLKDVNRLEERSGEFSLQYLEQPTPRRDLMMLREATLCSSIPVMADESVQTVDDVRRIADLGAASLINIKLQKMGGLTPAHNVDVISESAGMRTMLGCMDESALSIAAALHFGATHSNVTFHDLDGHLDLMSDPFSGLVSLEQGKLSIKGVPGRLRTNQPGFFSDL